MESLLIVSRSLNVLCDNLKVTKAIKKEKNVPEYVYKTK